MLMIRIIKEERCLKIAYSKPWMDLFFKLMNYLFINTQTNQQTLI